MLEYGWKRLLSGFLALTLVAGMMPPVTVAAEETQATEVVDVQETEPVTTEPVETEPVEETEATEETVPETTAETEVETTEATEETVAETTETTEATESALPENVAAVQALIDALPTLDILTAEDYDAVQAAYDAFDALTEEEKALIQGAEKFEALFNWFNAQITTLEDNTCGENLTWTLEDGTLTISGTGDMENYGQSHYVPWDFYRVTITSVVIEDGVTSIGGYAFYQCTNLTSVTIPDGVTSIDLYAFGYCSNLTNITLPESITDIGSWVFSGCTSLTDIFYSGTLKDFAKVWYKAPDLTGVTIHHKDGEDTFVSLGTCGEDLLWTLDKDGVLHISGTGAMDAYSWDNSPWDSYTSQVSALVLDDGITSIGRYAFNHCSKLTEVTIPASVSYIDGRAFRYCDKLADIHFLHRPWNPLELDSSAFAIDGYMASLYTRVHVLNLKEIPAALTAYNWSGSSRVAAYLAAEPIPVQTLSITPGDTEAEVGVPVSYRIQVTPAGTTSDILWSIIPGTGTASVTRQGVVTGLSAGTVTVRATSGDNAAIYAEASLTILPPSGGEPTAITVTSGGTYENEVAVGETIPMHVAFTPANASSRNVTWEVQNGTGTAKIDQQGNLTGLTPGSVTVYATADNGPENSCTVNVMRYAESAQIFFDGKSDTTSMGIGETKYLTAVLTPEDTTTTEVEWWIIRGTGAAKLNISYTYDKRIQAARITGTAAGTVTVVATAKDSHAVVAKAALKITDTIRAYPVTGGNIYYNTETGWITGSDSSVTNAVIPSTIEDTTIVGIASDAFRNGSSDNENTTLIAVSIPATVREIGNRAFYNCTALSNLRFSGTSQLTTIGEQAFYYCKSLANLTVPESVTTVGDKAFYYLSGLKKLTISGEADSHRWGFGYYYDECLESITYTGSYIRSGERTTYPSGGYSTKSGVYCSAKKLIISDSVTTIGDYAFTGGYNITTEVVLGEHVTSIGKYAFLGCSGLTTINLPESLTYLGEGCFENCGMNRVVLGEHVTTIEQYAFWNCQNLTTINLPESLTYLGEGCFENCTKLNMVDLSQIPDTISDAEYLLSGKATLADHIIKATGGKVSFEWGAWHVRDDHTYDNSVAYVIHYANGKVYLESRSSGQIKLTCWDEYTGLRSSKIIEIKAGLQIRPTDLGYLTSGQSIQLSAWMMPSGTKTDAYWFLSEGDEDYAALTFTGKLTAKDVPGARQITVNAVPNSGGEAVTKSIWILPKTTGLTIDQGTALEVDMHEADTLTLSVTSTPTGASEDVTWTTSDKKIATVDENGEVTLLTPGTVTITATTADGSKKSAKVTLTVYYLDKQTKLTAVSDASALGLQPGQTATITVSGSGELEPGDLRFSIPANQRSIATVDENTGVVTAGTTPGTVTVTAAIRNDPLNRTAACKIKVIDMQAEALELSAMVEEPVQMDKNTVILDAQNVAADTYTFRVFASAKNYKGEDFTPTVTWASSNTAIATVKTEKDGTTAVTVKKGAGGECAITATAKDMGKVSATLWLSIRDYCPRLETTKLTLNTVQENGVTLELLDSYGNAITGLRLYEDGAEEPSTRFAVALGEDTLTIQAMEAVKAGTYKLRLEADCANHQTYFYDLQLKLTSTLPTVTLKQNTKFNLFYLDSAAEITVTAKDALVQNAVLESDTFTGDYANGMLTLRYHDDYVPGTKVNTKAIVKVWLEGYNSAVTKTITISTITTAPKLKLSSASSIINTKLSEDRSTEFRILNSATGEVLDLTGAIVECGNEFVSLATQDSSVVLSLNGFTGGTATLLVQDSNWTKAVKLTHKVTVQEALPTMKLATGTLKLNPVFPELGAETAITLSQGNLTLSEMEITSTAKDGTALAGEAAKLNVEWDGSTGITATIADASVKAGTYAFSCVGTLENGEPLKAVTLKITVSATTPRVKLGSTTFKLNRNLAGQESVSTKVTVPAGYTLVGFDGGEDVFSYEDGCLTASLTDEADLGGTYILYPVLKPEGSDEEVSLNAGLKVKVTTYSAKVTATVAAKGKLDTLNPDSAITYTVKLKNCAGTISDAVSLSGQDGDLFQAEVRDGKVIVTMLDDTEYATGRTYKVTLDMIACGQDVSVNVSFKVTQSALKLALTPGSVTCYQALGRVSTTLKCTSPVTAQIAEVSLNAKTSAAFLTALGENELQFAPETGRVTFHLAHPGLLTPGKSYTLCLDVTPQNAASNAKPAQVKLTIKVQK